jgi:hypothetical protein
MRRLVIIKSDPAKDEERTCKAKGINELSEFELYFVYTSFFVSTCQFLLSYPIVVGTSISHSAFFYCVT